jgi:hypothetical protein
MKTLTVRALVYGFGVLLTACGGGGGGSGGGGGGGGGGGPTVTGNGFAPSTGLGDTSAYFPVGAADTWQYDYSTTDPRATSPTGVLSVSVNGSKTVQGASATVFTQSASNNPGASYDRYFGVTAGGVTDLGNTDSGDTISPLIIPYVDLLFPVQTGTISTVVGTNLPAGKDASGNAVTLDLTQTIANTMIETVDVPAGTYTNAMRQVTTVNATAHDNGQSAPITGTETTWLVPGIGIVKDTTSVMSAAQTISSDVELRTAVVNGQTHGFGAAASLTTVIPTGDMTMSLPQSPAITSDGTNFLIVTIQRQVSGGTETQNWIGTLVTPNGGTPPFNVTAPAAPPPPTSPVRAVVAFDGTNYLIVYEVDHTPALPTLEAVTFSPAGVQVAGPNLVATADDGPSESHFEALAYASSSGKYLLVYPQQVGSVSQLYGVFIAPATATSSGAAFAVAPDSKQGGAAVASDGTDFLVAWDEQSAAPGLEVAKVSSGSSAVSAPLVVFNESGTCCGDLAPALSFDGSNYLVVYRDTRGQSNPAATQTLSAARISAAGALLDGSATSPGIVVTSTRNQALGPPTSAFMLGAHWIVWVGADGALHGSRVSTVGAVPAAWTEGFALAPSGSIANPQLASRAADGYLSWISGTSAPVTLAGLRVFGR